MSKDQAMLDLQREIRTTRHHLTSPLTLEGRGEALARIEVLTDQLVSLTSERVPAPGAPQPQAMQTVARGGRGWFHR